MIWILAAVIITVWSFIYYTITDDVWSGTGAGLVTAFVSGASAFALCAVLGAVLYDPEPNVYTFDVLAAKDGSSTEGHFGIFGGTIDEVQYYFFYRQFADGHIEQGKIREADTVIYEDQESRSYIQVSRADLDMEFWGINHSQGPDYEIHVPPGSVLPVVEFDLE